MVSHNQQQSTHPWIDWVGVVLFVAVLFVVVLFVVTDHIQGSYILTCTVLLCTSIETSFLKMLTMSRIEPGTFMFLTKQRLLTTRPMVPLQIKTLYNRTNLSTECTVQHCTVPRVL